MPWAAKTDDQAVHDPIWTLVFGRGMRQTMSESDQDAPDLAHQEQNQDLLPAHFSRLLYPLLYCYRAK